MCVGSNLAITGSPAPSRLASASVPISLGPGSNFPTYLFDGARDSNAGWQGPINSSNAALLGEVWSFATGGSVWAQPIIVNGVVYVGSSDGYEYAVYASNGTFLWKTFLGVDNATPICGGSPGVTSTATFFGGTIYVNGGYPDFYALNASNGHIRWQLPVGGSNAGGFYLWASPLIYNHSAYVGIASQCDQPLVPAGLERISLTTHREIAYFNSSTPNPNGSSIWGSPSVNPQTNTIFVTTGNPYGTLTSKYGESIVALNASTLSVITSWQIPRSQSFPDADFGVTPVLFNLSNGLGAVAAENKNGYLYTWYQSNLTLVWESKIATEGGDHFSGAAADGRLFVVAHGVVIGGVSYNSSISALNPDSGKILWQVGSAAVPNGGYSVPLITNKVLIVPIGLSLYCLNAVSGHVLARLQLGSVSTPPASVSRGEIFVGDGHHLIAYDVHLRLTASQSDPSGPAPLTDSFNDTPTGGVPAYSYSWTFGDGTGSTLRDPTHTYQSPGTYIAKLTVTDLTGTMVTQQLSVVVSSPTPRRLAAEQLPWALEESP